ncbi:MAG TPA: hypothetical protein VHG28_02040 [Longimicrobiaceae bacterium]|nr:hypothetical protein [Longimicrobiaceae bacterium]
MDQSDFGEDPAASVTEVEFDRLVIRETEHWIWQVHENQSFLGRSILRLTRPLTLSLVHCSPDEWLSLRAELTLYERFIHSLWAPDRFNYGQLGNVFHQLHVHAVPRYRAERTWRGISFLDHRWGHNWAPTPASPLSVEQSYELAEWLRGELRGFEEEHRC